MNVSIIVINIVIILFLLTILIWMIWGYSILNHFFSKIEQENNETDLPEIPDGRDFDKHFLSVMNKSKGRDKLNDRERKIMSILYEQYRFERTREEIERRHYH